MLTSAAQTTDLIFPHYLVCEAAAQLKDLFVCVNPVHMWRENGLKLENKSTFTFDVSQTGEDVKPVTGFNDVVTAVERLPT